ncbi:nose resistant to fluoxetine protein 6-like [Cydia fagiglandana]|uniref:nose resistant to fluoxetine protein 6-like n=1 Tax=Cydia fagiglandana TaxID=1458189 RepID=UPI002FEE06C2
MPPRAVLVCALLACLLACARADAAISASDLTAEEYYSMPQLFHLDEYESCVATRGVYCLGSFELSPDGESRVFRLMQEYSSNWVDNFNHTRLHRGLCVSRRCSDSNTALQVPEPSMDSWFASCVNASTMSSHNLSARLYQLDYCQRGQESARPLDAADRAFPVVLAALAALAGVSTALELLLSPQTKKEYQWALCWSLPGCWRALRAPPPAVSAAGDLRVFDGVRVFCMMCVIIEHVCWLSTISYLTDIRYFETIRRSGDAILLGNSTLVVQVFFLMASFLLAHKILLQTSKGSMPPWRSFFSTMINRIIRISPSYYMVVWFAASWWARLGAGPQWAPRVAAEAAVCRAKWWVHLLYLNNVLDADNKCLVQTWYLAADMQLYAVALLLTLALARWRRGALPTLMALLLISVGGLFAVSYWLKLVSTFVMHNPEVVRVKYYGDLSFNILYQSPLGNAPGTLAGLLLAYVHHEMLERNKQPQQYRWFRWVTSAGAPLAMWWAAWSPLLLGAGAPERAPAAALAALERPVFSLFVGLALLGAMHGVQPIWVRFFAWRGWGPAARLSFGALLLHMPINTALIAARRAPTEFNRLSIIVEWFGVAGAAYLAALPLALLVELPAQRLQRALEQLCRAPPPEPRPQPVEKTNL